MNEEYIKILKALFKLSEEQPNRRRGFVPGIVNRKIKGKIGITQDILKDLKEMGYVRSEKYQMRGSNFPAKDCYELSVRGKDFLEKSESIVHRGIPVEKKRTSGSRKNYINPKIISDFKAKKNKFNYRKLVGILEGLNRSYSQDDAYSCSQLVKALVNHVPPLLGEYRTFASAASEFSWEKAHLPYINSIKAYMDEANDVTHTVISAVEDQASMDTLPNKHHINTLLAVCLAESDSNKPLPKKRSQKNIESTKSTKNIEIDIYAEWRGNRHDGRILLDVTNDESESYTLQSISFNGIEFKQVRRIKSRETAGIELQAEYPFTKEITDLAIVVKRYQHRYQIHQKVVSESIADGQYNILEIVPDTENITEL